jgi:tartrate dehydratase alpha subunit/fumarate hydratase class I-like protein
MVHNIDVAESTDNLLCQDTGIPIYNVTIGRGVQVDGTRCSRPSAAAASAPRVNTRCARRSCTR